MAFPRPLLSSCLLLAAGSAGAATVDITSTSGNVAIGRVVYNVGGSPVIQTSEATGVNSVGNGSVLLESVRTAGGTDLTHFNTGVAKVFNVNPELSSISGVGVFDNGVTIASNAGAQAFADAVAATSMDTDLRNFTYHDYLTPGPTNPLVADLDLHFTRGLNTTDHLIVSERWGNSSFLLLALAADGEPYANSNILRLGGNGTLGGPTMTGYLSHDWNTGYAAAGNTPTQAQALTLFSVAKFFEGSTATAGPVYGLRIFNYDEADVKILGISDNTFLDNPENPKLVPEPASLFLAFTSGLLLIFRRNRR
jgi:hypothetical protein